MTPPPLAVLLASLLACPVALAQGPSHPHTMPPPRATYGSTVTLQLGQPLHFEDGLSLELTSFSHKRARTGGPTKATAYVTLKKGGVTKTLLLSSHGVDGRPGPDTYDSLRWEAYHFQLTGFAYDRHIDVVITRAN